jgi:hypothetical protein
VKFYPAPKAILYGAGTRTGAQVGCVGAKLLYPDARVQHAGIYLGVGNLAAHAYRFAPANMRGRLNRMATVQNVSAVTAACLLIRIAV